MPREDNLTTAELRARLEERRKRADGIRKERKRLAERLDDVRHAIRQVRKRIKHRLAHQRGGEVAAKWCRTKLGVTEHPYGSNWGVPVQDWIKFTGYGGPVPWCGCFACFAVVHEGGAKIPVRVRLGYHGYIDQDARANRNGLHAVSVNDARPGDVVAYDFAHVGVIVGPTRDGMVHAIEGNTSSGISGSQNNGGGVYERRRPVGDVLVIARPDY